jgi:hypothetical protein
MRGLRQLGRQPLARRQGAQVKEGTRRTKLIGGTKEPVLEILVNVGAFMSLTVPAERRAEVDALIAALEATRAPS